MVTNVLWIYFQAAEVGRNKKKKVAGTERCWCAGQVLQRGRAQDRGSTSFAIPDVLSLRLNFFP